MFDHKNISNLVFGETVEDFYLLTAADIRTTRKQEAYLSMTLTDKSGAIPARQWQTTGDVGAGDVGRIVKVRASVCTYQGQKQLSICSIEAVSVDDCPCWMKIIPNTGTFWADLETVKGYFAQITDESLQAVCRYVWKMYWEKLTTMPAAKSIHQAVINGWLQHTGNMMKLADRMAEDYAEQVNRDLLIAGVFLHDFGKVFEFEISECGLVSDYTVAGKLLGHSYLGAAAVKAICEELGTPEEYALMLQHMILAHHGSPECGAAVPPMFPEAELLSLVDSADSRMAIYKEQSASVEPGATSGVIYALKHRIYKPKLGAAPVLSA